MKKFFEKHSVAKAIGIVVFIAIILTWCFKSLSLLEYSGTESFHRIGFSNILTAFYYGISSVLDKIIFVLALGGFYGIIRKTTGYNKLVASITKKIKGKEILFTLITSIVIAVMASLFSQTFAVLIFVPMLITIMLNAGLNKLTAFAATFGAILVGVLGATYGSESLINFNLYYSYYTTADSAMKLTLGYRTIILAIGVALYNFFLYFAVKKSLDKKNKDKEVIDDEFVIESSSKKNVKLFPIIIVLSIVGIFTVLGFIDWSGIFNVNCFNKFHEWLIGLGGSVKEPGIVSNVLGSNAVAFGQFDLFAISIVLIVFALLTAVLYGLKLDEIISEFGNGLKSFIKPAGALAAVYLVFGIMYLSPVVPTIVEKINNKDTHEYVNIDYNGAGYAFFNLDTDKDGEADLNLINIDTDKDGKCDLNCDTNKDGFPDKNLDFDGNGQITDYDETLAAQFNATSTANLDTDGDGLADVNVTTDYNLPKIMISSIITGSLNPDSGFAGYTVGTYLVSNYSGLYFKVTFLVFVAIFGLLQFFVPTSLVLMLGLTYADISIKDWMKYIWRFILGMFIVLTIIFILLLIL